MKDKEKQDYKQVQARLLAKHLIESENRQKCSKEKQISKNKEINNLANTLYNRQDKYDLSNPFEVAKCVIDLGYRKIDKDSVVLSREEYKTWFKKDGYFLGYKDGEDSAVNYYENLVIPSKKQETAEKILNEMFEHITTPEVWEDLRTLWLRICSSKKANLPIWNLLIEPIAKQFGVEIKE